MRTGASQPGRLGDEFRKQKKDFEVQADCKMPQGLSFSQMRLYFDDQLRKIIRPRNQSDRTSFRRIGNWLIRGIEDKRFAVDIWEIVLGYAAEAAGPESRNPAAVFMSILKRELDYQK